MDRGFRAAEERIERESIEKTGALDLGLLGLKELPGSLFQLAHLRLLSLGDQWFDGERWHRASGGHGPNDLVRDLIRLKDLPELRDLALSRLPLSDLRFLDKLALDCLDISNTGLTTLDGLAPQSRLRRLRVDGLSISDLAPVSSLTLLERLSLDHTLAIDLGPLSGLFNLVSISARSTKVNDLRPIESLSNLDTLRLDATQVADIAPLSHFGKLTRLSLSGAPVSDLNPLANLKDLTEIDISETRVQRIESLRELPRCRALRVSSCQIESYEPIGSMTSLQSLSCGFGPLSDLSIVANLQHLTTLFASYTGVSDLSPLSSLSELQSLRVVGSPVDTIDPLRELASLETLAISRTAVRALTAAAGLHALIKIECSGTEVCDLSPLASLPSLTTIICDGTQVQTFEPLSRLVGLVRLLATNTRVDDLKPLAGIEALERLEIARTRVSDISPIASLPNLAHVDISETNIRSIDALLAKPVARIVARGCELASLPGDAKEYEKGVSLNLSNATVHGLPNELFAESGHASDHAPDLAAHFRDLASGHVSLARAKLLILGNGRLGKTQLRRRLFDESYDESIPSTHGVQVVTHDLETGQPKRPVLVTAWDFGGQDIYHGTHALFMRTRAIFTVCWSPEFEGSIDKDPTGLEFRNRPLPYWLDYIRDVSGENVPVVVVQTRCDSPNAHCPVSPAARERLEKFSFWRSLPYSSQNDRGRGALESALADAVDWMRDEYGDVLIGRGRLAILRKLEEFRTEDASAPDEQKSWRFMSRQQFDELCVSTGDISSSGQLVRFLHNAGVVFYREGLFADRIILDQAWALNAIYAVFNRGQCVRQLRALNARFSRSLLEALVWSEYTQDEQELFISMMKSCGIIFTYRKPYDHQEEEEYIAPDLLPDRSAVESQIQVVWSAEGEVAEVRYEYEFLHDGFVRALVSTVGEIAGPNAIYWRGGMCAFDAETQSRTLLEEVRGDGWGGAVVVRARNGQKEALLERVGELVESLERRIGLKRVQPSGTESSTDEESQDEDVKSPSLKFVAEPRREPTYAVSYAWNDESDDGKDRERLVDEFCNQAKARGVVVLRDKTELGLGDDLRDFMDRISQAERIALFLSDRYLKSANCMYELYHAWNFHRRNPDLFLRTVRVFSLPSAKIWSPAGRVAYARYWSDEVQRIVDSARGDIHLLGESDFVAFKRMQQFSMCVGDILSVIAGKIQPRDFDDFVKLGLDPIG